MYVVVAQDSDCGMSVYGPFSDERTAESWADTYNGRGIELTVFPILDPRPERRQGQRARVEYGDAIAHHFGR